MKNFTIYMSVQAENNVEALQVASKLAQEYPKGMVQMDAHSARVTLGNKGDVIGWKPEESRQI